MKQFALCGHNDRDVPELKCGHPIPCPYHTAIIDLPRDRITMPFESNAINHAEKLREIGKALKKGKVVR